MPERIYEAGEKPTSEEFVVDDDITEYSLSLDRTGWVSTGRDVLSVQVELWLPARKINGVVQRPNWYKAGGCRVMGGTKIHRFGHTIFFSGIHFRIPKDSGRKIRVSFDVIDPVRIKSDLDLLIRNGSSALSLR